MRRFFKCAAAAAVLSASLTNVSSAAPVSVERNAKLRQAPATGYPVQRAKPRERVTPRYDYYNAFPPGYYSYGYYPRHRYGSGVGFGFEF